MSSYTFSLWCHHILCSMCLFWMESCCSIMWRPLGVPLCVRVRWEGPPRSQWNGSGLVTRSGTSQTKAVAHKGSSHTHTHTRPQLLQTATQTLLLCVLLRWRQRRHRSRTNQSSSICTAAIRSESHSSFYPNAVIIYSPSCHSNLYDFLSSVEHNRRCFEECSTQRPIIITSRKHLNSRLVRFFWSQMMLYVHQINIWWHTLLKIKVQKNLFIFENAI